MTTYTRYRLTPKVHSLGFISATVTAKNFDIAVKEVSTRIKALFPHKPYLGNGDYHVMESFTYATPGKRISKVLVGPLLTIGDFMCKEFNVREPTDVYLAMTEELAEELDPVSLDAMTAACEKLMPLIGEADAAAICAELVTNHFCGKDFDLVANAVDEARSSY